MILLQLTALNNCPLEEGTIPDQCHNEIKPGWVTLKLYWFVLFYKVSLSTQGYRTVLVSSFKTLASSSKRVCGDQSETKVCLIIIVSNSGADNSASRHDSLNLKGSAESGEKND